MTPLVSIIVPVFNAEKYLEKCIQSLLDQTLKNIEIILVDDVSTDSSLEIIEKYKRKDTRIEVIILEKNSGPSFARNIGIKNAKGDYLGFVDSDDYVSDTMYEKMYSTAIKNNAEIISSGYQKCDDNNRILASHLPSIKTGALIEHDEMVDIILHAHKSRFIWFACRNIYKREMILSNSILFEENIRYGEETLFNLYAFYCSRGVFAINESLYFYRANPSSLTSSKERPLLEGNLIELYKKKYEFYIKYQLQKGVIKDLSQYVSSHQLPMMLFNALACNSNKSKDKIKEILSLEMVRTSLRNTSIINRRVPLGIQLIIFLCKLRQIHLLKLYLSN